MNENQRKKVDDLIIKNEQFIKDLEELYEKYNIEYSKYDHIENEFMDLATKMEKSHSKIYFVPFNNYYSIINNKFCIPSMPLILEDYPAPYGRLNSDFSQLAPEYIEKIENDFSEKTKKMIEILNINVSSLQKLFSKIIASNSIVQRLSGLEDKLSKLQEMAKKLWFPRDISESEYKLKGQFRSPSILSGLHKQLELPFHRQMLIRFEPFFKTRNYHILLLQKFQGELEYINEFLPFAELVPLKENPKTVVNNNFSPKQNQIGSNNNFDGEISIGNENT